MLSERDLFSHKEDNFGVKTALAESIDRIIKENIDFILSHFSIQREIFPRTITAGKRKYQKKIDYESDGQISRKNIFDYFKQSNFVDCKISAYPYNTGYGQLDFDIKNQTAADFIMIDLDLEHFDNKDILDMQLNKTVKKLSLAFKGEAHPTILWTGNGYHVYQPTEGIIFEKEQIFYDFLPYLDGRDLTTEFIRFAERFISNGKADPKHLPSINSCLIRIPGTLNSKNAEQVRIIQQWDGKTPNIRWIASDFFDYLVDKRIKKIKERKKREKSRSKYNLSSHYHNDLSIRRIEWIEKLLQIPLEDYRKDCIWRILCPYLTNVKKLPEEEIIVILEKWLEKCDHTRKTDFNHRLVIKKNLRYVKSYLPPSRDRIKEDLPKLYSILKAKNIFG